jgi:hypothetical protein
MASSVAAATTHATVDTHPSIWRSYAEFKKKRLSKRGAALPFGGPTGTKPAYQTKRVSRPNEPIMSSPVFPLNMQPQAAFPLVHFDYFLLRVLELTYSNRTRVMKVVARLVNGQGVYHRAKTGGFCVGYPVTLADDLHALRRMANVWLPYTGANCLDRGHGFVLNHPIQKMILFKEWLEALEAASPPSTPMETRHRRDSPTPSSGRSWHE